MWDIARIRVVAALLSCLVPGIALAGGIEHPDNAAYSIGRGGAWAANPDGGLAFQYNPAGLAQQKGLRLTIDSQLVFTDLKFTPAGGGAAIENEAGPFFAPAAAISYGLGEVGPLSALTIAVGATGPSAVGKLEYPINGAQRYALISSDYFIGYYSLALAATYNKMISLGLTGQLVHGTAKFKQAIWSGEGGEAGRLQQTNQAISTVDVESDMIPTGVVGLTVTPMDGLAIGLSYRPRIDFEATGTLKTELPAGLQGLAEQQGESAKLVLLFPDVVRFGVQYDLMKELRAELDVVYEGWSKLETIQVQPEGIVIHDNIRNRDAPLTDIIFQKDFRDTWSVRVGGDYQLLPERLAVRLGYLYESSAIPKRSTSVDFPGWGPRNVVSVGASVRAFGAFLDLGYAYHIMPDRTVTNSNVKQIVAPCTANNCTTPEGAVVGNGDYSSAQQVFGASIRVPFDDIKGEP
jgi:long-chain fatty acid transport protein